MRHAAAELWDIETAPKEIDRVIRECFIKAGPVYIFLPLDLSAELVSADLLKTPIDTSPTIDEAAQKKAVDAITAAIAESRQPVVLVDALVKRLHAASEAREVVKKLGIPSFSANMGKGVIDEIDDLYVGVWNGEVGHPGVSAIGKQSDLMITVGYLPADTNSAGFTRRIDETRAIHINPFDVVVGSVDIPIPRVLLNLC